MRKDYFLTLLCLFLMALAQTVHADVNKIYGVTSINQMYPDRAPSFVYGNNEWDHTTIAPVDGSDPAVFMASGANCNGTYYGLLAKDGAALRFVTVDWATGATTDVSAADASCPLFTDMAYSFSTKKLYGMVKADAGGTDIYEITVAEGKATKVATVTEELKSFDFSFDGRMHTFYVKKHQTSYGENNVLFVRSYDENLASPTEETAIQNSYSDDYILIWYDRINVEFDHMTNTLYYTEYSSEVPTQQYANGVDITTWKQTGESVMLGANDPDITALYIPFTAPEGGSETPMAVTELKAAADPAGVAKATLTWVNPTTNFVGNDLTELHSIRVYRNSIGADNLLEEITDNVAPGGQMSWTDENADMGENKYVIVPCRIEGENGISAEVTVWVGFDIPGTVANVKLEKAEGGINVSWEKPATTVNGGILDEATLKYSVVRQPDNIIVAEDITETSVLDKNALPAWQKYSYQITARTAAGTGEATDGFMNIFAGPDLTAPYEFAFNDYDVYDNLWTVIGDEIGVGYLDSYNYNCWALMLPGWALAGGHTNRNNYLVSPEIKLNKGKYTISVGSWIELAGDANSFTLLYGKGKTADAFTNTIESFSFTAAADGQKDMATATFEIAEDGYYNFAINVTAPIINPDGYGNVGISLFRIEEAQAETFKVTGKVAGAEGNAIEGAEVTLHNDGKQFTATTAEDGTFSIDVEGSRGECIIVIKKEGYQDYRSYFDYEGTDIALETITMEQAPETFFVTGKVTDEDGNGIAEATVVVAMGDNFSPSVTQADGTFNVEVYGVRGEYTITVEKDGYTPYSGKFFYEGASVALEDIILDMTTGIGGIVYDGDGNADIRVYDMSGRLVKAGKVTRGEGLGLSNGVYIINGKKTVVK